MRKILGLKTRQAKKLVVCFVFMLVFLPLSVSGATTVGNDVSVGGTLGVTGATTLTGALVANGAVTLGNAASDLVTLGGYFDVMTVGDGTTTSTLGQDYLKVATGPDDALGLFYVDSSGNVSASGTLAVIGATTLTGALTANGNVTLGNAASDLVTLGGYFNVMTVGNLTSTSTLTQNTLAVGAVAADVLGKFYVDSSGNVSASGTLAVVGATTLTGALVANGAVTLGNAVTDNVTVNGYVVSDLIIYNATGKQIDIGDGTTTSTFEKDNLTLGYTAGYELGTFDVTNTGDVSASGTFKFTAATNATSTLLIDATGGTGKGSCFVLKDVAGTTKYLTILTGNTVDISTVDCRN